MLLPLSKESIWASTFLATVCLFPDVMEPTPLLLDGDHFPLSTTHSPLTWSINALASDTELR